MFESILVFTDYDPGYDNYILCYISKWNKIWYNIILYI